MWNISIPFYYRKKITTYCTPANQMKFFQAVCVSVYFILWMHIIFIIIHLSQQIMFIPMTGLTIEICPTSIFTMTHRRFISSFQLPEPSSFTFNIFLQKKFQRYNIRWLMVKTFNIFIYLLSFNPEVHSRNPYPYPFKGIFLIKITQFPKTLMAFFLCRFC